MLGRYPDRSGCSRGGEPGRENSGYSVGSGGLKSVTETLRIVWNCSLMKILHVYKTYLPDDFTGVPRVIHTLAENTGKYGVENEVFTLSKSPSATPLKIGSHLVRQFKCEINISSSSLSVSSILHSKRIFDGADIIHYHFPWPMGDLLYLLRGRSKPSLVTYHSDIVRQKNLLRFYRPVMTRFLDGVDEIVATSPNYRGQQSSSCPV